MALKRSTDNRSMSSASRLPNATRSTSNGSRSENHFKRPNVDVPRVASTDVSSGLGSEASQPIKDMFLSTVRTPSKQSVTVGESSNDSFVSPVFGSSLMFLRRNQCTGPRSGKRINFDAADFSRRRFLNDVADFDSQVAASPRTAQRFLSSVDEFDSQMPSCSLVDVTVNDIVDDQTSIVADSSQSSSQVSASQSTVAIAAIGSSQSSSGASDWNRKPSDDFFIHTNDTMESESAEDNNNTVSELALVYDEDDVEAGAASTDSDASDGESARSVCFLPATSRGQDGRSCSSPPSSRRRRRRLVKGGLADASKRSLAAQQSEVTIWRQRATTTRAALVCRVSSDYTVEYGLVRMVCQLVGDAAASGAASEDSGTGDTVAAAVDLDRTLSLFDDATGGSTDAAGNGMILLLMRQTVLDACLKQASSLGVVCSTGNLTGLEIHLYEPFQRLSGRRLDLPCVFCPNFVRVKKR